MSRIEAFRFNNTGIIKVSDGYEWRFNGTCIAKMKSDGDLIIKGIIETENDNPCSS